LISNALFLCVVIGTLSSTVFLGLAMAGAARFRRLSRQKQSQADLAASQLPPVSVLKPLHGDEPGLRENLASFFRQDYPAASELIFCARTEHDAGIAVARQLAAEHPQVTAKFVFSGEPPWPNAKIFSVSRMLDSAAHDHLIISDSDVWVSPDYLRSVMAPFSDPKVGLVTCVYRGRPMGGFWSRLEALGMTAEMSSGVMVADMLEGMKFALGPSMSTHRDYLARIGGIERLADYCADDFVLGALAGSAGYKVELSHYAVDHCALHRTFADSVAHQVRWMRSTRFSRPAGHLGTGLTFATPFALLALAAMPFSPHAPWLAALAAWNLLNPVIQSAMMGWVLADKHAVRYCWLFPLRNLFGFGYWLSSYFSSKIDWRRETYELYADGKMRLLRP
jgi:ceramide glucosyltransferase